MLHKRFSDFPTSRIPRFTPNSNSRTCYPGCKTNKVSAQLFFVQGSTSKYHVVSHLRDGKQVEPRVVRDLSLHQCWAKTWWTVPIAFSGSIVETGFSIFRAHFLHIVPENMCIADDPSVPVERDQCQEVVYGRPDFPRSSFSVLNVRNEKL